MDETVEEIVEEIEEKAVVEEVKKPAPKRSHSKKPAPEPKKSGDGKVTMKKNGVGKRVLETRIKELEKDGWELAK